MLFAQASSFAEYGLIGLVLCAVFTAIGWSGIQLLGKNGILRESAEAISANAEAIKGVTTCLMTDRDLSEVHAASCKVANVTISQFRDAALCALEEISQECEARGMDMNQRIERVRSQLR